MSLRERKKDKTRTQLLEAALELIGRQGFADTTISQIAAAVDVSPRTLLRYFPTKEDVIVSWVDDTITIFIDTLTARPQDEAAQQSLMAASRAMLEAYQQRSEFYLVIEKTIASSPSVSARKQEMSAALAERVEKHLQARAGSDFDSLRTEVLTAIVFSMIRVSIRRWLATDGKADLLSVFDKVTRIVPLTDDDMVDTEDV
ncbi:TetR family transcriptional regulator [Rhizobium sp. TH135]|uniref:TetR/AcrR family transcriptional regulator n=1 Tax=Rhizobium sp. TH135 TaxID=2067451 RepID=UPI000C7BFB1A|nr:TetR/AcrR family transcriptional regulator [Rhizobium sp. TH135]PLK73132.1 TetR family transcriptional regulator [Rhizobium sp. TH135]